MKSSRALGAILITAVGCTGGDSHTTLNSVEQRGSYAVGVTVGRDLANSPAQFDEDAIIAGIRDVLSDRTLQLTDEELQAAFQEFSQRTRDAVTQERQLVAEQNRLAGADFLLQNGQRTEVSITPSGLQYEVLERGSGPPPAASDVVTVHYIGTLIDGTEFDSSHRRGQPSSFQVDRVISGWTEGLQLMSVGSKFKFYIPSNLGYGDAGSGPVIGPNAVLIFEVELLGIE